jgi:hypothetical protein
MLDDIEGPEDLRGYDAAELGQIADELRSETIGSVAVSDGRLGSGLGVVEPTAAWRHVFAIPRHPLTWDRIHTGVRIHFIANSGELRREWFDDAKSVGVTAGASAPEMLVDGVVNWLRQLGPVEVSTLNGPDEALEFRLPPELASVSSLPRLLTAMARPLSQG